MLRSVPQDPHHGIVLTEAEVSGAETGGEHGMPVRVADFFPVPKILAHYFRQTIL